jgi:redox-sensing transcriptional repressor
MRISEYTVRRLSIYQRALEALEAQGQEVVSSEDLARLGGTNAAQVRKDLSFFGSFGKRGKGYEVGRLRRRIREILGTNRRWRVVIAGAGRLGSALASYGGFARIGFEVVALLDNDRSKIGGRIGGVPIHDVAEAGRVIEETGAVLGVIATPADVAQKVAEELVRAGVRAILNFAPAGIRVAPGIPVRHVDISVELEGLTFLLSNEGKVSFPGVREDLG